MEFKNNKYKIKLEYVIRHIFLKEKCKDLGKEIIHKKIAFSKAYKWKNCNFGEGATAVSIWCYRYKKYGICGILFSMSNKKLKERTIEERLEDLTLEETRDIIKIYDALIKKYNIPIKKDPLKEIKKESDCLSISNHKMIYFFGISESNYYYKPVINIERNMEYEHKKQVVFDTFNNTGKCMGAKKLTTVIKRRTGLKISNNTVQFFMNLLSLKPCAYIRKRYDPKNTKKGYENLVDRNFKAQTPNEVYTTDITYIHSKFSKNGFYYLSFFVDCFNNEILGVTISENPNTKLVMNSIKGLIFKPGTILHQDHGIQYTSKEYMNFIEENDLKGSMSRVGNSLDNRPSEYANGRIKLECINKLKFNERTMKNILIAVKKYVFHYNNDRIQSCLDDLSPVEFRNRYLEQLKNGYNTFKSTTKN